MKVFINPGHYPGKDSGAVGYGLNECDVVLKIGKQVDNILKVAGITTKLFQCDSLQQICTEANFWGADLFVSIHANASESHSANGTESFAYYDSVEGLKLANAINSKIVKNFPTLKDRGAKEINFFVLRNTAMTAALVETAFIDNYSDNQLLKSHADDFAKAIAQGILFYAGLKPDIVDFNADKILCPHCGTEFSL